MESSSEKNLSSLDKAQQQSQYAYSDCRLSEFPIQDSDSLISILQNPNNCVEEKWPSQRKDLRTRTQQEEEEEESRDETLIKCRLHSSSRKITKRKSSTSKRTLTRFIATDAANFRQMVQLVTGVRCCHQKQFVGSLMEAESQDCHLPTLDTSDFILYDHGQFPYSYLPTMAGEDGVRIFDPGCMADRIPWF